MAIDKATLKEMVGKRITIDGAKHRVEKVVMKTGLIVTRDGTEALAEGVYKKGPGFFYDSPTKGKKKPAAAAAEPVKETARARRAREKAEAEQPEETAREKRARLKREAAEAEEPKSTRSRRAAADKTPGAKGDGKAVPGKKKKLFEAFTQAIAERISQESYDLLTQAYGDKGDYAITPVAVGAAFDNDALKITITVMSAGKSQKEIKGYIRDHREATDIASDDEEDDDLDDDDLEDDDADDSLEEEDDDSLEDDEETDDEEEEDDEDAFLAELNELTLKDLRKIAKEMEIDDYKDFTKDDLAQELSEYEEDDVRESAVTAGVELGDGDDEDDDSEEDDSDDEDDDSDEDQEESATVEDLVGEILEAAPGLKEASVTKFVEAFLANDEIADKFDGELVPGRTQLQEKGGKGPEMLLVGFDADNDAIKLVNLTTGKTRSKTISEVVHMEILEAPAE